MADSRNLATIHYDALAKFLALKSQGKFCPKEALETARQEYISAREKYDKFWEPRTICGL